MKRNLTQVLVCLGLTSLMQAESKAQISLLKDYSNYTTATIGTYQGITVKEAGFSGMYPIPGTDGKEFWIISDRGPNIDDANANTASCRPTYDKMFIFPTYAPKIHRVRLHNNGDSIQILRTITIKRPGGTPATGVLNPTGFGSTATEVASTDTVQNCANFNNKTAAKDVWSLDGEGIVVDKDGNFWVCEENGATIWKINPNGVVIKRYSPYANLAGATSYDVQIDTVFKYRKNNRGFEGIAIAPNGKIYAMIQSPILYPNQSIGENTRVHRLLEIDPATNQQRMLVYVNDGIIGTGSNQIRLRDWKIGDMAAVNDSTFLVLEAAARGTTDIKRLYKININGATAVNSGFYGGQTLEALVDSAGLAFQGIFPVKKTLVMDLLGNGWPSALDKAEGLAIINDSTIAICNDNDFGTVSPNADGIATATGNLSHIITYKLSGNNKLNGYIAPATTLTSGMSAMNSSKDPYLTPFIPGVKFTSILTAGDAVGNGYKMVGTPDGLGAFDNGNGTFTLVMNHELGNTSGIARAHGSTGAFVSKWIINKSDLTVTSGSDLIQNVKLWNPATSTYITYNASFPGTTASFGRFCSADLPGQYAFWNPATGKGTQERIFMNGEETGAEGRGLAHIVTGPNGGTTWELPRLGKFSWENSLAWPGISDSTIVIGTDDATPGQVYVYVGAKQNTGNEIEKAGLTNGKLYGVKVNGMSLESNATFAAPNTAFMLADLGNVENMTGSALETASNNAGVTRFLRPEDGAWDPSSPNDFYFATTNGFGSPSRLWRLRFSNIANPTAGGTITAVLDGTEGQQMMDNITVDHSGHILIVEDVGNNAHNGKVWQYDIQTDGFTQIAMHDSTRFVNTPGVANYLTQDEEASGILDVQEILGNGMFLTVDQAHYPISGELVEGGQLLALYNPATAAANPEVDVLGNSISITDGTTTPAINNNTDFGNVAPNGNVTKNFVISNTGTAPLTISAVYFTGANAGDFTLNNAPAMPLTIAANSTQTITVKYSPAANGISNAAMNIITNDFSESTYDFALKGAAVSPEINVSGNSVNIIDGDATAGIANNTDFGTTNVNVAKTRSFVIQNTGAGDLTISGITFTGVNAAEFTLSGAPTFPLIVAANGSQTINVAFKPIAAGIRTAAINIASDDADEATYDFVLQGIGLDPTGVNDVNGAASFIRLYPNPTGGNATIAMDMKKEGKVIVQVFDIAGRQAIPAVNQMLRSGQQQVVLRTEGLANGTYFVQIASEAGVSKLKLVIAH